MSRLLFGSLLAVTLWPAAASAQIPVTTASGVGSFGGPVRPMTPALMAPFPRHPGLWPPALNPAFGPGFIGRPGLIGGGFYGGFYGGYPAYSSYYFNMPYNGPAPRYSADLAPAIPPVQNIALSNEFPATLTLAFPATARVWVNDKAGEGEPSDEWTLTSPVLRPDEKYTFRVRARWAKNGQDYEYTRDVTLGSGEKSRVLVITGTAVK